MRLFRKTMAIPSVGEALPGRPDPIPTPAEDHHQQYLARNPFGYCGHGGTGVGARSPAGAAA